MTGEVLRDWNGNPKPDCRYRSPDGSKCAAGHLIADNSYSPLLEGKLVSDGSVLAALRNSGVLMESDEDVHFIMDLQEAHDKSANAVLRNSGTFLELFNLAMAEVARVNNLAP